MIPLLSLLPFLPLPPPSLALPPSYRPLSPVSLFTHVTCWVDGCLCYTFVLAVASTYSFNHWQMSGNQDPCCHWATNILLWIDSSGGPGGGRGSSMPPLRLKRRGMKKEEKEELERGKIGEKPFSFLTPSWVWKRTVKLGDLNAV